MPGAGDDRLLEVERPRGRASSACRERASSTRSRSRTARRNSCAARGSCCATGPPPSSWRSTRRARRRRATRRCASARAPTGSSPGHRLPARGHHLRPEHPHRRHRHRGAQQLRRRFLRGHQDHQGDAAPRQGLRRRLQRLLLLPRQQPRARGHARGVPLPRDRGRPRHGDRQRRHARRLRGDPKDLLERVEDVILNRRPDATERLVTFADELKASQGGASRIESKEDLAWRDAPVEERLSHALVKGIDAFVESGHRGGARRHRQVSPAALEHHRGPAHGRHARRRRPLRRRARCSFPRSSSRPA
jgi:hypothetical protein